MNAKQNALRILRFDNPERVMSGCPTHDIGYRGCHHEGFEGGGHHLPVGSVWRDIWGTEWHREHAGVMGFPRGNPLANPASDLAAYAWPEADDDRIVGQIRSGLIAEGPISAIRAEVHRRIWQLGRDGGYFCGPDQGMPWPEAHIQALRDAVAEFGQYPIREFDEHSGAVSSFETLARPQRLGATSKQGG